MILLQRRSYMIKVYLSPNCSSYIKVREWFKKEQITFKEINILNHE